MTKLRKQRRAKKFNYSQNKKKLNRKNQVPAVTEEMLRTGWEESKSAAQNLAEMGLSLNPNKAVPIPNINFKEESVPVVKCKLAISKKMEEEIAGPRKKLFRLPKGQVDALCRFIDRHGGNYEEMAKDTELNIFQSTSKQLRQKIKLFMSIPEQWEPYVERRKKELESRTDQEEMDVVNRNKLKDKERRKRMKKLKKVKNKLPNNSFQVM